VVTALARSLRGGIAMQITQARSRSLSFLAAVLALGAMTSSASAQTGDSPSATPRATARGAVELVCLDHLDAGATRAIVQMLVERDAEITADPQTNCLIVLGASNLAPVREVIADLEREAVRQPATRRAAGRRSSGRPHTPGPER
jgi:hypothetical protein